VFPCFRLPAFPSSRLCLRLPTSFPAFPHLRLPASLTFVGSSHVGRVCHFVSPSCFKLEVHFDPCWAHFQFCHTLSHGNVFFFFSMTSFFIFVFLDGFFTGFFLQFFVFCVFFFCFGLLLALSPGIFFYSFLLLSILFFLFVLTWLLFSYLQSRYFFPFPL
jgi:hypothetical protein